MDQSRRPHHVIGPLGERMTLQDLPSAGARWVPRRKAQIVAAVEGDMLTIDEACSRYNLTVEEFVSWQTAVDRAGLLGLRVTKLQAYKEARARGCRLGR